MPATRHGFCGLHKVAYNRELDAYCPQCILGHIFPTKQYDFDERLQKPVDDHGAALEPRDTRATE